MSIHPARLHARPVLLAALLFMSLSGCKGCDDDPEPVTYESFNEDASRVVLEALLCRAAFECPDRILLGLESYYAISRYGTVEACVQALEQEDGLTLFEDEDETRAIEAGRANFDSSLGRECLSYIREVGQRVCDPDFDINTEGPEACENYIQGTLSEGDACLSDVECQNGLDCVESIDGETCYGTCRPEGQVACNGQLCTADQHCGFDENLERGCLPRVALGEPCEEFDTCLGEDTVCNLDPQGQGTCVQEFSLGEGEACVFDSVCQSDLECLNDVCTARAYTVVSDGETCDSNSQSPILCAPGYFCNDEGSGTCAQLLAADVACQQTVQCELGLYCSPETATCRPLQGEGGECFSDSACDAALECIGEGFDENFDPTAGACGEPLANGVACEESSDCESRQCIDGFCGARMEACMLP